MKTKIDLDEHLHLNFGYLIRRIHQVADGIFEREMRDLGLTPVQYGILIAVSQSPGIDQYDLGLTIGVDRNTISFVVQKLLAKQLIRTSKDAADRRSNLLSLSAKGEQILDAAVPRATRAVDILVGAISARDHATLRRLVSRIIKSHEAGTMKPRTTARARRRAIEARRGHRRR